MVFDLVNQYPNLSAELRKTSSLVSLTSKPHADRKARLPAAACGRGNNAPVPSTRRVPAAWNLPPSTTSFHPHASATLLPPVDENDDDACSVTTAGAARTKPLDAATKLAKARELPLGSSVVDTARRCQLGQSQSAPSLMRQPPAAEATAPFPTIFQQPVATQRVPSIVLGQGRPRVRFARRSQPGSHPLGGSTQSRFGLDLPTRNNHDVDTAAVTESDGGCFLTEIELDSQYVPVAYGLALGSYQLYGHANLTLALATFHHVRMTCPILRLAEDLDDVPLQALIYHHVGTAEKEMGDFKSSLASQMKCIALAHSAHHVPLQGRGFKGLGVVYVSTQQYALAYDYHVKCLVIATSEGDLDLASRTHANLGNVFSAQRQFADALASHTNDLNLSTQLNSYMGMARAHRNLALVYAKMNDVNKQRQHDDDAAALGRMPFRRDVQHHAHDVVGNIYMQLDAAGESAMAKKTAQYLVDLLDQDTATTV
ncbi:Aste57867_7502 [Aphanomyces stellatus]|uniref:Aste57867_7502 protein n=1 Tax=Aphanomyces stellatus TaxID=120398 RepID=A0A485KIE1_9STRA|nr:hypothetical protein As57867_007476 [Aphanomyces stellatus]VFT84411.1 Aste57867_7502 [Aphanomyces stellatus]